MSEEKKTLKALTNKKASYWRHADNKRVGRSGHQGGWDQMRQRMVGIDGRPMVYTFDTCVDSVRTIPSLQHDPLRPEDLDTSSEDHAADEWRYSLMSRPMPATKKPVDARTLDTKPTLNDLIKLNSKKKAKPKRKRI